MALGFDDLGDVASGTGALGAQGLGDFSTPGFVNAPDVAPAIGTGADFASLGGAISDASAGFSGGSAFDSGSPALSGFDFNPAPVTAMGATGFNFSPDISGGAAPGGASDLLGGDQSQDNSLQSQSSGAGPMTGAAAGAAKSAGGGLSQLQKTGIMAAPALGIAGYEALRGPQVPSQLGDLNALAGQQAAFGAQQQANYNAGTIAPGSALQIQNNARQQLSQLQQYYAKNRGGNYQSSTDYIKAAQQIQNNATAQYQQFLQGELTASLQASGQAGQYFAQAAQIQLSADQAFNNALMGAMTGIGKIAGVGLSGGTTTTTTTTAAA
jgi:hypothetical protein